MKFPLEFAIISGWSFFFFCFSSRMQMRLCVLRYGSLGRETTWKNQVLRSAAIQLRASYARELPRLTLFLRPPTFPRIYRQFLADPPRQPVCRLLKPPACSAAAVELSFYAKTKEFARLLESGRVGEGTGRC